ncbi:MAG: 3-deoxy-7-phosphoheptulonate synthase [Clostridia bacterium]|nr:3-deoxy-7-phosphoheptulonate synthase [Clostridia bacterium]
MIIIMKPDAGQENINQIVNDLRDMQMDVQINRGVECTVLGVLGQTTDIDTSALELDPSVDRVVRVSEPFKKANRKFHPEDTVIDVDGAKIGGDKLALIAGPCSVESEEQIIDIAKRVKASGATFLRGGAFKPRTSPYAFQGMQFEGLELLQEAKRETGLPIVSEIMAPKYVEVFDYAVDVVQVGARNMQNFDLLKELGKTKKPVLLKRGLSSTLEEWLMSAEYIMAGGNDKVILCERGIRTFEHYTRNTLDLSAIPAIKKLSHLPVVVDPSHATGMHWMVLPMAMAAVAAGADGLMIEVHNDPLRAKCDGPQSITPEMFDDLTKKLAKTAEVVGRGL